MPLVRSVEQALLTHEVLDAELKAWSAERANAPEFKDPEGPVVDRLHEAGPVALCLSGGGIRSATFGLGVLQGLARKGLLKELDYISTVSGGGYIGSWLTSWIARRCKENNSAPDVCKDVFYRLSEGDETHPYEQSQEPVEISHLRAYSNYLTPRLGILSADTWTLAATWLRNVIVNWFVLLPFFLAILAVPRIWASAVADGAPITLTLLATAGLAGLILVVYLAMVRPVPGEARDSNDDRRYGWLFALLGPGMLVVQALAMCYVRAIPDGGTGPSAAWWNATWGFTSNLPFGTEMAHYVSNLPADRELPLMFSLMLTVMLLNHIGWGIYTTRLYRATGVKHWRRWVLEFFGAAVAGGTTGWFLWLIIVRLFSAPMSGIATAPLSFGALRVEAFVVFAPSLYLLAFFVQTMMFVGITGKLNDDQDREWWARWAGWLLIISVSTMAIGAIAVYGPLLIAAIPRTVAALGGVTGLITLVLGRSGSSPATPSVKASQTRAAKLANLSLSTAAPIFAVVIIAFLSFLNTWLLRTAFEVPAVVPAAAAKVEGALEPLAVMHFSVLRNTPLQLVASYAALLMALSLLTSLFVQANRFSMHGLYRNRLTRAYLGASNAKRRASAFTGFDENDNVAMDDLPRRPFHVVNATLNIITDRNLAWQERKAAPFTMTPLHSGGALVGYQPSTQYSKQSDDRGITLGTAMAISGAAVSPNMGYHTSSAMSLLLTLFNVRLGWWLGNPSRHCYGNTGPDSSLVTILKEAFGRTGQRSRWIYLSDGGHFENLGLYEMVRRRCHTIIVSDAGRDPKIAFEDLGNAIRKIRIDLGIPVTLDETKIYPRDAKCAGRYFATGTIHYNVVDPGAPDGQLIYVKPCFYGSEPIDIRNYASLSLEFPHESTADQWFTESQFESYRALGAHAVEEMCRRERMASFDALFESLRQGAPAAAPSEPLVTAGLRKPGSSEASAENPAPETVKTAMGSISGA